MEERNIALEEVNQIIPVVERIENLYAQVTQLEQRSETIMADEERRKKRFKKLLRLPARLIVIATALVILHLNKKNLELTQAGIIFGVGIATAIIFYFLMSKTVVGNMKPRKESLRRIASNDELIQQLHGEMGDYYQQNIDLLESFPPDYQYIEAVRFFQKALLNRRADSLKEAINLYEDYLYKQNMTETVRQQHAEQVAYLQSIENASYTAANNAARAASDINFWGTVNHMSRSA